MQTETPFVQLANTAFFSHTREKLFSGGLEQTQVDGINALVLAGVQNSLTVQQHAYVLATAYHETAKTMRPVREYGRGEGRKYGTWRTNSYGVKYCLKNGSGNAHVVPATVICRSAIASSKADCTFAGARLISSAKIRLWNNGPFWKWNEPSFGWNTSVPVMSAGNKSGVN